MKKLCGVASMGLVVLLSACGGGSSGGPSYDDVVKDPSKAQAACESAFKGDDLNTFTPLSPKDADIKVRGSWDSPQLECELVEPQDGTTSIYFSNRMPETQSSVSSHQGRLYGWISTMPSSGFPSQAQERFDKITKGLAD